MLSRMASRRAIPQGRLFNNYTIQDTMSYVLRVRTPCASALDLMNQRARQAAPFNERGVARLTRFQRDIPDLRIS